MQQLSQLVTFLFHREQNTALLCALRSIVAWAVQERKLRAYSRDGSPAHVDAVKHGFERWVSKMWNDQVVTSTPLRPPQTLVRNPAATSALQAGHLDLPRQRLADAAVQLGVHLAVHVEDSTVRMEKKRKIQLHSIPE